MNLFPKVIIETLNQSEILTTMGYKKPDEREFD